jgi:C_GCAxxG_C_C family probable redox protein
MFDEASHKKRKISDSCIIGGWIMGEQASQRSLELFRSGFFCAESVLLAIAESQGIQSDLIPRIATGFCSGISRTGGMCGAVSGAIMGINLVVGRNSPAESIEVSYTLTQKLISHFEEQYGSVYCHQLIGCDLATEAGQRYFMEKNLMEHCLQYAEDATGMAVSLIADFH